MSAVAVLSPEQLRSLLEDAAEKGATKALERAQGAAGELTTEQAAAELGIAPKTVRKWVKEGRLVPSRRVGQEFRFRREAVEKARSWRGRPAELAASMADALCGGKG